MIIIHVYLPYGTNEVLGPIKQLVCEMHMEALLLDV